MVVLIMLRNSQDQRTPWGQLSSKKGGSMLESTMDGAFWKNLKWWCWSRKACCLENDQTAASNSAPCWGTGEPVECMPIHVYCWVVGWQLNVPGQFRWKQVPGGGVIVQATKHLLADPFLQSVSCPKTRHQTASYSCCCMFGVWNATTATPSYPSVHIILSNIMYRWAHQCSIRSLTHVRRRDHDL